MADKRSNLGQSINDEYRLGPTNKGNELIKKGNILRREECSKEALRRERRRIYCKKWGANNKEKISIQKKEYGKINAEKIRLRKRLHYLVNRDRYRAKQKAYHDKHKDGAILWKSKNKDKVRASDKRYKEKLKRTNREKHDAIAANRQNVRRGRILGAQGRMSPCLPRRLMVDQKFKCVYCRSDLRLAKPHVDHVIPLARGGSNFDSNFQLTCALCNQRKAAKHPFDFAAEMKIVLNPLLVAI